MSQLSQNSRLVRIKTPLPVDTFIVTALDGEEAVSNDFHFELSLLSNDHAIKHTDLLGKAVTISIYTEGDSKCRYINGYVNNLRMLDVNDDGLRGYQISVVSGLWFTSLNSENRVFQEQSAKDIIEQVLSHYASVLKVDFSLNGTVLTREYCVQFDETDFEFVHRLLAEEGISYYFEHKDGEHKIKFIDDAQAFFDCDVDPLDYDGGGSQPTRNSIHRWERSFAFHTGGVETTDYSEFATTNTYKSSVSTSSTLNAASSYKMKHFGIYRFKPDQDPKHAFESSDNTHRATSILEAEEGQHDTAVGTSDSGQLCSGGRFTIEHPISSEAGDYTITRLRLTAREGNGRDTFFENEFECVPSGKIVRPIWRFPPKTIDAPQVATVEEVKATASDSSQDTFTQLKVKFPWFSDATSCWVRVAQQFAGKNWGANFVPRIGQEVIVTYINGDPARPIITGAVYNGTNEGPNYTATQSGWKTLYDNSKFNELRFDDKPDQEEVYMEAGKDHNWVVHNDQTGLVENNQSLEVIQDRTVLVSKGNESITVAKGNRTVDVDEGNYETTVGKGDMSVDVNKGDLDVAVKQGDYSTTVNQGDMTTKVSMGDHSTTVGQGDHKLKVSMGNRQVDVSMGDHKVKCNLGKYTVNAMGGVKIESIGGIELKCGPSSIKMTPAGITIKGIMVNVKGDAMAEVKAGAMVTVKGAITMIN